jgi:hypothetical protein
MIRILPTILEDSQTGLENVQVEIQGTACKRIDNRQDRLEAYVSHTVAYQEVLDTHLPSPIGKLMRCYRLEPSMQTQEIG